MVALAHLNDEVSPLNTTTDSQRLFIKTLIENQRVMSENPDKHKENEKIINDKLFTFPDKVTHGLFLIFYYSQEIKTEIRNFNKTDRIIISESNHLDIIIRGLKKLWPKYYQVEILDNKTIQNIKSLLQYISQIELDELTYFKSLIISLNQT